MKWKNTVAMLLGLSVMCGMHVSHAVSVSVEQHIADPERGSKGSTSDKPELGEEYKQIPSFAKFREKLLADGWEPIPCERCLEEVTKTKEECAADPADFSCRLCVMFPELNLMNHSGTIMFSYRKAGRELSVSTYGDITRVEKADEDEPIVSAWSYEDGGAVILLDMNEVERQYHQSGHLE